MKDGYLWQVRSLHFLLKVYYEKVFKNSKNPVGFHQKMTGRDVFGVDFILR